MRYVVVVAIFMVLVSQAAWAQEDAYCKDVIARVDKEGQLISPATSYQVAGAEKLYFATAPDAKCLGTDVFLVKGDKVIVYFQYKGWFNIMYINPKTGEDFQGWVKGDSLIFIGSIGSRQ